MFDDTQPRGGFDLQDATVKKYESPIPKADAQEPIVKRSKLDGDAMVEMHRRVMAYYVQELDRQAENRYEMGLDEDFYDNIQWDYQDAQTLKDRGQVPLVYNVIATSVNWVLGSEKRGRTDFKVLPRRKEDGKPAERKTALMKYLSDVNRTPFHRSRAFEDEVKVGIGWLEDGVQDDVDGEPVYSRYESWRNILWDSAATEMDLSDARYIFRAKWVDLDIAQAMFPERKAILNECAVQSDNRLLMDDEHGDEPMDSMEVEREYSGSATISANAYQRERVRLIEGWIRRPVMVKRMRGGDFSGDIWDGENEVHREQLQSGRAEVVQKVMMRVHVCVMCTKGMLWFSESPYRHNRFPFTPLWGYRRGRDGLPYGMIRGLRDIQQDINKRASKALAILSSNKVIMDKGAVDNIDEFIDEVSKPNAVIEKNPGKALEINAERDLAAAHVELMARSIQMIQQQSGVTDESMGRTTNATSGVAIARRQEQGSMATAKFFDNLRFAAQLQGELELSLIEQYFSQQKAFRITNMRGTPEYIVINDGLPENDIVRTKADFIISEADWRASVRQAQVDELLDLITKLAPVAPQAVLVTLDLLVESMDLPMRDELVRRIRQLTGQRDPDAEEPTPEEIAQAQEMVEQKALQKRGMMAEIVSKEADAIKKQADAQKAGVQAQQILGQMAGQNVETQKAALEAALAAISMPPAVPVADTILHEAGFKSRTEMESDNALAARAAEAEQQAAEEQAAAQQRLQQEEQAEQQSGLSAPGAAPTPEQPGIQQ
ncbi:MAG TPA: hypothetical protein VNQ97_11840 [Burkholderiaceae bacterium]|nr:hypothetical protein [Burkholderiaceae bacterium]